MRNGIEMYRLVKLVRLHRMGTGKREIARLLAMSPNTERQYRDALGEAGLLDGEVEELPDVGTLQKAVHEALPGKTPAQQVSSIDAWAEKIEAMVDRGAAPKAIFDLLKLREVEVFHLQAGDLGVSRADLQADGENGTVPDALQGLRVRRVEDLPGLCRGERGCGAVLAVHPRPTDVAHRVCEDDVPVDEVAEQRVPGKIV